MKLVYFKQPGCEPCDVKLPIAQTVAVLTDLELEVVDVHDAGELATACAVRATPTLVLISRGERIVGWTGGMISVSSCVAVVQRYTDPLTICPNCARNQSYHGLNHCKYCGAPEPEHGYYQEQ